MMDKRIPGTGFGSADNPTFSVPPENSRLTGTVNVSYEKLERELFFALPEPKAPLPCFEAHEASKLYLRS